MMFKTELHAHTSEVSPCADLTCEEVAERYIAQGYASIVVTNHYTDNVLNMLGDTREEKIDRYLLPYRTMKDFAEDRLHVILGCELRFIESANDYLIFGLTEDFLMGHPDLHLMNLKTFSELAHENGLLIVQAHPFRNGMKVMRPELLDGIETFNGHMGHDSRNPIADAWAKRYGLIRTSGTDFHHPYQSPCGGILTKDPIKTEEALLTVLRSKEYDLYCTGPVSEREGILSHSAKY